ncbi:MAG: Kelch repeat-containing protein, partial [Planctomycetota bacterium]
NSGEIPLGPFYPDLIGCKLVHVQHTGQLMIIPQFGKDESGYRVMSVASPKWEAKKGTYPKNLIPARGTRPRAYCYLPGLKRVLLLKGRWHYARAKTPVGSWLIDVEGTKWEPICGGLRMSDKSEDFELAKGKDGAATPLWGTMCFDPHNKEALSFGGGGVWGRVGKVKSKVVPGDWIYDQAKKRCRRLTEEDKGKVTEARRWFPAHCGTWTFSEAEKKWKALEQPLHEGPSGRILPGMAYDAGGKKIVLFGGDDLARCLNDTWVYDCPTRTWKEVEPPVSPTARAGHAMVYVPEAKGILMCGGYTGGWKGLSDVWIYRTAEGKWRRLGLDLPRAMCYASGVYLPKEKAVFMACYPSGRRNKKVPVYAMKLDTASAPGAAAAKDDPKMAYHCRAKRRPTDLPGEWLTGKGAPEKKEAVLARLKSLPANTWKNMNPTKLAPERNWGSYIYDVKTHRGFAWGGGHSAYPGAEISTYDLLTNRWDGMAQPTNYNPVWLHGMVGGPPGISFGGWSLLPSHARKSYGVDPVSNSVVTYAGDVFSIEHRSVISHVGPFPARFGVSTQAAYVTMPDGLYGFASSTLARVNVAAGKWEMIDNKGPKGHHEYDFLAADTKRGRILYFKSKGAEVWTFDLKAKSWAQEQPAGGKPAAVKGDATYIPEMDAVLTVFATVKKGPEKLYFYRCAEKKWYTAPSTGDPFRGGNFGKDWSPIYDPELKIVVRITPTGFHQWVNVHVMRLEPESLKLTALE